MNWRALFGINDPDIPQILAEAEKIDHGRRSFLRGALLATGAAATLDIEQLLWIPNPMIVVPQMPNVHGFYNTFITPSWITKDVVVNFKNSLKFIDKIERSWRP